MGFLSGLSNRVKDFLSQDKESQAKRLAKGATTAGALVGYGKDMLQVFGYDSIAAYLNIENDLLARFADYEEMDDSPEISAAINIYADESTQNDYETKKPVWVVSNDKTIEMLLDDDLLRKRLRMGDEEIWEIARTCMKYGNDYEELLVDNTGVVGLNFLPPATVRRIEGPRGELFGFVQDYRGRYGYTPYDFQALIKARFQANPTGLNPKDDHIPGSFGNWERPGRSRATAFEDWEIVHFRLRGKARRSIYGHSALEPARWIWKRLQLLEDSALIYRLQRAPERFAFYVDVGDLPPAEALHYVNRVRQQYKKRKFFDPATGKLNLRWEPLTQDDDFFIPVRKGQEGARVEVLGAPQWQHMEDIEYFRDKMFAAIQVPKSYLSQEHGVPRQILSNQDVAFARTVLRVQRELRNGVSRICRIHLSALGIDPYRVEYAVHMATPSSIYELAQIEVMNARADLAARMKEFVSEYWILHKIFGIQDEDIEQIMEQREEDAERLQAQQLKFQSQMNDQQLQFQGQMGQQQIGNQVTSTLAMQQAGALLPQQQAAPAPARNNKTAPKSSRRGEEVDTLVRRAADGFATPNIRSLGEGLLRGRYSSGRWEQAVMSGDRQAEKRAEGKIDRLLANDRELASRLEDLGGLLQDLQRARRGSNGTP